MPNQNPPDPNQDNTQSTGQPIDVTPPVTFPHSDLPPLSPDFQGLPKNDTPKPIIGDSGSSAPPDISSSIPKPKKKFGGGKIIATILGLVVLVGGVGAGVFLTQQQQVLAPKACGDGGGLSCNSLSKNVDQPKVGDNVTFTCEGTFSSNNPVAEFRWKIDAGEWITEPDVQLDSITHKAVKEVAIDRTGTWAWQCRICTNNTKTTCTAWN